MSIENQSRASSLNEIEDELSDAELNNVSGGAKPTTTKTTIKPTTKQTETYLEITLQDAQLPG
jgi:bacteriocin-like protein